MGAGQPGAAGSAGRDGKPGSDGLSITAAIVNTEGNLILTRSDGSTFNAGRARGQDGSLNIEGSNLNSLVDNTAFQTAVADKMTTTAKLDNIASALGNTIKSDSSLRSSFTNQLAATPNFYSTLSQSLDYSKVKSDVAANQVIWCADGSINTCKIPSMKTGIRFGSDDNNGNLTYNTQGNKFNFTKPVQIGDDSQGGQFQVGQHFGFNSPQSGNPIINIGKDNNRNAGNGVRWQIENVTGGSLETSKLVFKRNAALAGANTDNWENSFQITHEGIEIPQPKRLFFGNGDSRIFDDANLKIATDDKIVFNVGSQTLEMNNNNGKSTLKIGSWNLRDDGDWLSIFKDGHENNRLAISKDGGFGGGAGDRIVQYNHKTQLKSERHNNWCLHAHDDSNHVEAEPCENWSHQKWFISRG